MSELLKNQRNIFIAIASGITLMVLIWYYGFHQGLASAYNDMKKSKKSLVSKRNNYKRMKTEIINIQNDWDILNEEFETVIQRIPDKSSFDRVSNALYLMLKNNGLSIKNYSPSNIAIDKKTIFLPESEDEIIIEKIPVDIEVKGSYVNFGKFLETMAHSRYRLTASNIDIEKKGSSASQTIKFISYAYFQTEVKKKPLAKAITPKSSQKKRTLKQADTPTNQIDRPKDAPENVPDWMFEPITETEIETKPEKKVTHETSPKKKKPKSKNDFEGAFHNIVILDSKMCKKVKNNLPLDPGSTFTTDIGRIYCHSLLDNNSGKTNDIYHIWYMNDQLIAKVRIRVPGGKEIPAISRREVEAADKGTWKVVITDDDKKILDTVIFELV